MRRTRVGAGRAWCRASGRLVLAVIAAASACASPRSAATDAGVVIRIHAQKFAFSPDAIQVKVGVPVTMELDSADVVHGFDMPDFHARTDIVPGQMARVHFVPDKAGTFPFRCDVFCGEGHEEMAGQVTVTR